jgi:hypothetical protein
MRHIAIIGLGEGMNEAPMSLERWGLPWSGDSSYDLYFEVHSRDVRPFTDRYKKKLSDLFVPVLMQERTEGVENSLAYPRAAVEMVGGYLESSISYMLAYAIYDGVEKITIYGVGCPFDSHYVQQRSNLEYLIGFARARGIDVEISDESELLQSFWSAGIYGFDKENLRPGTEHVH